MGDETSEAGLRHVEAIARAAAPASPVFDYLDRPEQLSAHMARRSWRMGWTTMAIETDAAGGRVVGSHIRFAARGFGIALFTECIVSRREPPAFKQWETVGEPRLLVIGGYRMSVHLEPRRDVTLVTVAIDYALPRRWPRRLLGHLFGRRYARWCVREIARDVVHQFSRAS